MRVTHVGAYLVGWRRIDPQQVGDCDLKRDLRGRNLLQRLGMAPQQTFGLVRPHLGEERSGEILASLGARLRPGGDLCRYLRVAVEPGTLVPSFLSPVRVSPVGRREERLLDHPKKRPWDWLAPPRPGARLPSL